VLVYQLLIVMFALENQLVGSRNPTAFMKQADNRLRTLEFQDSPIYYLALPEGNVVLIRPLCEALGVDADRQIRDLKIDEMIGDEVSEQTTRLPSEDRSRPYTCLPEEYIYGWVFNIKFANTMKPETRANLVAYKRDCYHALFQHFHGRIKQTQELDKEAAIIDLELEAVEKRLQRKLQTDPDHLRKLELEAKKKLVQRAQRQSRQQDKQTAFDFALGMQEPEPSPTEE
jgi:hypothetical protein